MPPHEVVVGARTVLKVMHHVAEVSRDVIVWAGPMLKIVEHICKRLHDLVVLPELDAAEENLHVGID